MVGPAQVVVGVVAVVATVQVVVAMVVTVVEVRARVRSLRNSDVSI